MLGFMAANANLSKILLTHTHLVEPVTIRAKTCRIHVKKDTIKSEVERVEIGKNGSLRYNSGTTTQIQA
jgi:hypothetical protein